jgi:hypothetical protein
MPGQYIQSAIHNQFFSIRMYFFYTHG